MLEKLKPYVNSIAQWKNVFSQRSEKKSHVKGRCCIDIDSTEFSIAYALDEKDKKKLILCESYRYTSNDEFIAVLSELVKQYQLNTINGSWILRSDQYQLLLMESLMVPANEFQAAIRWKIKDLVHFPLDDIVVESFPLPLKKATTSQEMIMVVIAEASELLHMSEQLQHCGLLLNTIDIPELCFRNLTALYEHEDKNEAFIYIQEKNSHLIITAKKQLQFARRIELGLHLIESLQGNTTNDTEIAQKMDRFALEIQRSFDYYQSQWRQTIPTEIILAMIKPILLDVPGLLSQRLSISVKMLDMTPYFASENVPSVSNQGKYLPIIGGILRRENGD